MRTITAEIRKPENAADFELMCTDVYGVVFKDATPKRNGRSGQRQAGVDIFVQSAVGRIGIQCKRYQDGKLKIKHIHEEIGRADSAKSPIVRLIVATTAANDSGLLREVLDLSDHRVAIGLYPVEVEFWGEISAHINRHAILQDSFAPTSPGAAFHRAESAGIEHQASLKQITVMLESDSAKKTDIFEKINLMMAQSSGSVDTMLPAVRTDSVNKYINQRLDNISEFLKISRYVDASKHLEESGRDLTDFDAHQKARWYMQRGITRVHLQNPLAAASDFVTAYQLYPADEKIAAAYIRSFIFSDRIAEGISAGEVALQVFPSSLYVWVALTQARMIDGEDIVVGDFPPEFAHEPEVLQLLCWAACQRNEFALAVQYGKEILTIDKHDFYGRSTALIAALSMAIDDPLVRNLGAIPESILSNLEAAVKVFEPRSKNLWTNQSEITLAADASNLAYSYIVLSKPEIALQILDEYPISPLPLQFINIKLEALRDLGRYTEFIAYAKASITEIMPQALFMVAETVANIGDIEFFEVLVSLISTQLPESLAEVSSLRWLVLYRSGDKVAAVNAILTAGLDKEKKPLVLLTAIRILFACEAKAVAMPFLDRAISIATNDGSPEVLLYLADLLFLAKRYAESAMFYSANISNCPCAMLRLKLLRAYIRSGQQGKARVLLDSFPVGWEKDDEIRREGIYLAQMASDRSRLSSLAAFELERFPTNASSWLLIIRVKVHELSPSDFMTLLRTIPTNLDGESKEVAQIASLEIRYGEVAAGMLRLYRLYRSNLEDADVASYFMTTILMAQPELPWMDASVSMITEGCSFCLENANGGKHFLSIDPQAAGDLPKNPKFLNHRDSKCALYLGLVVGDFVEVEHKLGTIQRFKIVEITTAFRRLLQLTQERAASPIDGLPNITSVQVVSEDGEFDFSVMHKMQKSRSERINFVFEQYASKQMTLGICAWAIGTSVLKLVYNWPANRIAMKVTPGDTLTRDSALRLLKAANPTCVLDLATLTELVLLKAELVLQVFDKVYVSTTTQHDLHAALEEAEIQNIVGTTAEIDDQFRVIEYTDQQKKHYLELLNCMQLCIDTYCEVIPSYGAHDISADAVKLEPFLGHDEYQALLLAHEKKALLLSVDQNLRAIGSTTFGVQGIWPQVLLMYAVNTGLITKNAFHGAVGFHFLGNRSYVSITGENLAWLMMLDKLELSATVKLIQREFSLETSEFWSTVAALEECLQVLLMKGSPLESILRCIEIFYETHFRHPSCPDNFLDTACRRMFAFVQRIFLMEPLTYVDMHDVPLKEATLNLFMRQIYSAKEKVLTMKQNDIIGLTVLKVAKNPIVVIDP